jgi:hypothetical protein
VAAAEGDVAEVEIIAEPEAEPTAVAGDDSDIEDAETAEPDSPEPASPAAAAGSRRPWWRRLLPLR